MSGQLIAVFFFALAVVSWVALRRASRKSCIGQIPGPKSPSWIYGKEYGQNEFEWQKKYGPVYSIKTCFGESRLMVSDPLATKFILNSYIFAHGAAQHKAANSMFGHGNIFLAQEEYHRHLRNIMNPSFSSQNVRRMLPMIKDVGMKLVDRWETLGYPGTTVDITRTMHEAALDLMGEAIFEHQFNGLTGQSEMAKIQRAVLETVSSVSKPSQLVDACLPYIPDFIFRLTLQLPIPAIRTLQQYINATDELGRQLVQQERSNMSSEKDRTFISRLIKPDSPDATAGVIDKAIGVHVRTILLAGEDTTGNTLSWILYRLALAPDFQQALREEVQLTTANSGDNIDYENMPLLNAIINETLRLYSSLPFTERVAKRDCILPLSQPITTTTGSQITEMPIEKGQAIYVAISSFHRLTSLWGPDADEFRPSRWLEGQPCKGSALGPHASLLSFIAGPGVCLGWRFALMEMQVLVTEIVRKFVLSLPAGDSTKPCYRLSLVAKTADGVQEIPIHIENVA